MALEQVTHVQSHQPSRRRIGWAAVACVLLGVSAACQSTTATRAPTTHAEAECVTAMPEMTSVMNGDGVYAVTGDDSAHHRLRFVDGQVSRNDSCMIRLGNRLNTKVPPLYINGEPVGFC